MYKSAYLPTPTPTQILSRNLSPNRPLPTDREGMDTPPSSNCAIIHASKSDSVGPLIQEHGEILATKITLSPPDPLFSFWLSKATSQSSELTFVICFIYFLKLLLHKNGMPVEKVGAPVGNPAFVVAIDPIQTVIKSQIFRKFRTKPPIFGQKSGHLETS